MYQHLLNPFLIIHLTHRIQHKNRQSHMDPSDIISTDFPLHQLCTFVAYSLVWTLLVAFMCRKLQYQTPGSYKSGFINVILVIGISTIIIHCTFILCGIHPTMFPFHTLVSAYYVAVNMLLPVLIFMPQSSTSQHQYIQHDGSVMMEVIFKMKEVSSYIFGPSLVIEQSKKEHTDDHKQKQQDLQRIQCIHQYATLGTLIGMAICAILRILDHGMQIQRYPIPIILGSTWGSYAGVFIGSLLVKRMIRSS